MHQLGLTGVTCGIFNHEGTWEFDPVKVMATLNSDFPNAPFPWRKFSFLNLRDYRAGGLGKFDALPNRLNDYYDTNLIQELKDNGIEANEEDLTALTRNREGRIIWIEEDRFKHIVDRHAGEFKYTFGIEDNAMTIGNFIFYAIKNYPIHKILTEVSQEKKIYVYRILRQGQTNYLHIIILDIGWIVTAYPSWRDT